MSGKENTLLPMPDPVPNVEVVTAITSFLRPIAEDLATGTAFKGAWMAPGLWRE